MKPIMFRSTVSIPEDVKRQLRRELCKLHGVPKGVPMGEQPSAEHEDACFTMERSLSVSLVIKRIRKDGYCEVEATLLTPPEKVKS